MKQTAARPLARLPEMTGDEFAFAVGYLEDTLKALHDRLGALAAYPGDQRMAAAVLRESIEDAIDRLTDTLDQRRLRSLYHAIVDQAEKAAAR